MEAVTASSSTASSSIQELKPPKQRCNICNEILGALRSDGQIETASILPCSHVFGSLCISRVGRPPPSNYPIPILTIASVARDRFPAPRLSQLPATHDIPRMWAHNQAFRYLPCSKMRRREGYAGEMLSV